MRYQAIKLKNLITDQKYGFNISEGNGSINMKGWDGVATGPEQTVMLSGDGLQKVQLSINPLGTITPPETLYLFQSDTFDGDTNMVDTMGNAIITNNGLFHSTEQAKFGGSSFKFTGSNGFYVGTNDDAAVGVNDCSIDFWIYRTGTLGTAGIPGQSTVGAKGLGGFTGGIAIDHVGVVSNSDNVGYVQPNYAPRLNEWDHIAVVRHNSVMYFYVNGELMGTPAANTVNGVVKTFVVGGRYTSYAGGLGGCYLDEIRFIPNAAPWQNGESFTPPEAPYTL